MNEYETVTTVRDVLMLLIPCLCTGGSGSDERATDFERQRP